MLVFLSPRVLCAKDFQQEQRRIVSILVEGNARVETAAVLNQISTRVGQGVNQETIAQDIRTLYELEYFKSIEVFEEPVSDQDGLAVIFKVQEKPARHNNQF